MLQRRARGCEGTLTTGPVLTRVQACEEWGGFAFPILKSRTVSRTAISFPHVIDDGATIYWLRLSTKS